MKMEEMSGCKVDIDKRANVIAVRGRDKDKRDIVEKMILDEVSWCRRAGSGEVLKTDYFTAEDGGDGPGGKRSGGDGPNGGTGGVGTDMDPEKLRAQYGEPIEFYVLDKEAGRVIGRGGEVIREIMRRSEAMIRVERQEGEGSEASLPEERKISVFADDESKRERAKNLILAEVSWAKDMQGRTVKDDPSAAGPAAGGSNKRMAAAEVDKGKRMPTLVTYVCGYCGGDHRTRDCPARMQNTTALQILQLLGFNMLPSPIPGMPGELFYG